jgi:hypothetical protein
MNEEIKNLADEISLRLLATKYHDDYEWLISKLEEMTKILNTK